MIIDCHTHYTTAPLELQAYRGRQITDLGKPVKAKLQISDEELERSMQNQFKRMKDSGIHRLLFSPQASAMGHHFGPPIVSRYWTEACNDLIARVAKRWPDKISPVCQLPQSPGVNPRNGSMSLTAASRSWVSSAATSTRIWPADVSLSL